MPETIRETTERVVTDDPASTPEPGSMNPPPADAPASSPDPATMQATTEAIAVGAAIGEKIGEAKVAAEVATATAAAATSEAINWQARAEAAEAERESLRARVTELETPPVVEEVAAEVVDVPAKEKPETNVAPPKKPRSFLRTILLG